mgnify:CR=1 FL=1
MPERGTWNAEFRIIRLYLTTIFLQGFLTESSRSEPEASAKTLHPSFPYASAPRNPRTFLSVQTSLDLAAARVEGQNSDAVRVARGEADAERNERDDPTAPGGTRRQRRRDGGAGGDRHPVAAVVLSVILVGSAVSAYLYTGSPNQPSLPYAEREDERKQRTAGTRGQQMNLSALADRLKKRLSEDADSVQGWQLLARTYMTMGNFAEAVPAFEQLIALNGADSGTFAAYGEAIALAAQGSITPKSQAAFREALAKNFKEPTARFYLALADWQHGEHRKAYDGWVALMAETPSNATWAGVLQQRLMEASEKLGLDVVALPKLLPPSAPPEGATAENSPQRPGGPTEEDVAAVVASAEGDGQPAAACSLSPCLRAWASSAARTSFAPASSAAVYSRNRSSPFGPTT